MKLKLSKQHHKLIQFINDLLIGEIGRLVNDCKSHYFAFSLISQGIELLGACFDNHDFEAKRMSEKRFKKAINELFVPLNSLYGTYNQDESAFCLYKNLRCSLIHQVRPGKIGLTHRKESVRETTKHLQISKIEKQKYLIIVIEELYNDFKCACEEVIRRIRNGQLSSPKLKKDFYFTT